MYRSSGGHQKGKNAERMRGPGFASLGHGVNNVMTVISEAAKEWRAYENAASPEMECYHQLYKV